MAKYASVLFQSPFATLLFPPSYVSARFYPIWSISQQMWAISPLSGAEEGELSNVGEAEGLASEEEEATEMMVVKWLMKGRACLVGKKEDI